MSHTVAASRAASAVSSFPAPAPRAPAFAAFVGLDRSDAKLDLCVQLPCGSAPEFATIDSAPETIAPWLEALGERFTTEISKGAMVAICLEQPAGGLLYHFANYQWLTIYAVNPMSLTRHRETLVRSQAKSDAGDAFYLMDLVRQYPDRLPVWRPADAAVRKIAALTQDRRSAVDLRTQLSNRLKAHLKGYFPQSFELSGGDFSTPLACDFLLRWPSLMEVKRARKATLQQFYNDHNCRSKSVIERRLKLIQESVSLHDDEALIDVAVMTTRFLIGQLKQARESITAYDAAIAAAMACHDDAFIYESLPGSGKVWSARMLGAMGSNREQFEDAAAVEKYSGIAPVIKASGKKRIVQRRRAKTKFVHQTFVEYADQSIRHCAWALAFYRSQRTLGKGHYAAIRALAFKWIRIIYRCWAERTVYDEAKYLEALRRSRSPLINLLTQAGGGVAK